MTSITVYLSSDNMFAFGMEYECLRYERQACRRQLFSTQAKERLEVTCDVIDIDYDRHCIMLLLKERFFMAEHCGYTDSWVLYRLLCDEDKTEDKWEVGVKKALTERVCFVGEDDIEDTGGYYPYWKEDFLPMEYLDELPFEDTEALLKAVRSTFLWMYGDDMC